MISLQRLRHSAVSRTLFQTRSIAEAVKRLGFVQADPIRAPARAQDLILRQRVPGYVAGRLEQQYPRLRLHEDMLHVYGFLPEAQRALLGNHNISPRWLPFEQEHRRLRSKVLAFMREAGTAHPREVERAIGVGATVNGWGAQSSAATLLLEALHRRGVLRVARRDNGVRVYGVADPAPRLAPRERADGLLRIFAKLYAPLPERTLRELAGDVDYRVPSVNLRERIDVLVRKGELERAVVDGVAWVWLPGDMDPPTEPDDRVRFLAPFDPVVWDRRRFELLWGWPYRFEAYTPVAKRKLGYYAMPLLWQDRVIGWANATLTEGRLGVTTGFVAQAPRSPAFRRALEEETQALGTFLGLK